MNLARGNPVGCRLVFWAAHMGVFKGRLTAGGPKGVRGAVGLGVMRRFSERKIIERRSGLAAFKDERASSSNLQSQSQRRAPTRAERRLPVDRMGPPMANGAARGSCRHNRLPSAGECPSG